ncbi:MAG: DUF1697 domain-containing protein [Proteobacteria bacterium]|nr:DUF1697 domain-containing protein [Pseudomonadota bacterium]
MTRYVAWLRGVNVGGHHRMMMADLRDVFVELGYLDVTTYLQSGNVVFGAPRPPAEATLAARIEAAVATRFGFATDVVLRTAAELADVVARNPFLSADLAEADHAKLHVLFAAGAPTPAALARLPVSGPIDRYVLDGREAFVHYGNGAGKAKLKLELGLPVTARNWRTVTAVLALLTGRSDRVGHRVS